MKKQLQNIFKVMKSFVLTVSLCVFFILNTMAQVTQKWTPPLGVYSGSMTAFSYVTINGVDPESDYIEIGAFNGAECRGAGMVDYYADLSGYYCFLMIYGDASVTITFKVYDHVTDTEYDAENIEVYTTNATLGLPPGPPYEIIVLAEITPTYSISLTPATNKDFGVETEGYSALPAHSVTVSNTGNQPTGNLSISLSGANAGSFTLSKTTISNIAIDGNDSFTVVPNTGLGVGSYTATVTVSGDNDIMESFEVSFEVLAEAVPPVITTTTLPNGKVGEEYEVTLTATGNTPITWTLASGSLPNGLNLSQAGVISGVPTLKGSYSFTVQAGNAAGNAVKALTITVDPKMKWTPPLGVYSGSMTAFSYVTIDGVDPESDYLEIGAFNGTECRGAGMVNYYDQLGYYCFLMIYGDASFTITFKVYDHATGTEYDAENVEVYTANTTLGLPPEPPYEIIVLTGMSSTYGISLTPATNKDFGVETVGYSALPAHSVTVSNTGNQPTGNLTVALSGANAGSFTLSKTTINSIAIDGNDSFTVVPNTGLGVGSYTATVTVTGDNDIMESFEVSFETEPNVGIDNEFTGLQEIAIYPNPTTGELTIDNGQLTMDNIEVFDIYGRKQKTIFNFQFSIINSIDVSQLAKGIYFLKIRTEAGEVMKKVVKL